ncbi:MAG: PD-(D/E)XK nuclease family protein [Pseudomonadota bacterium]
MDKGAVFAIPLGVDYARAFVDGFCDRIPDHQDRAQSIIFVNTERTKRRLVELFVEAGPTLIPQIYSFAEIAHDPFFVSDAAEAPDPIHTQLTLAEMISGLLKARPDLAPQAAVYDLAESLQNLMSELQGEAVALKNLTNLDLSDHAEQWAISQTFLKILLQYEADSGLSSSALRYHHVLDDLERYWQEFPPTAQVFVIGSTGSRNESLRLMKLVLSLDSGTVVLPGVDPNLKEDWPLFTDDTPQLDHPQGVLAKTLRSLDRTPDDLDTWQDHEKTARNDLLSLSLIPAPVTDRWRDVGFNLVPQLHDATKALSLLESQDQRQEALAIAAILREAAEDRRSAALITPDRNLSRRVSAQLDRWGILPDDSAGQPLHQSPEGIFLRLIAQGLDGPIQPQVLLALLSHSATHQGEGRAAHALMVQKFDLKFLRNPNPVFEADKIKAWADPLGAEVIFWAHWLSKVLGLFQTRNTLHLKDWIDHLIEAVQLLTTGTNAQENSFWASDAAVRIDQHLTSLKTAPYASKLSAFEFSKLLGNVLRDELPLPAHLAHPLISIWGTLEARVQGADLVILGGLNEGIWPQSDEPDIWLSRDMRKQLGLLPPERLIGLSAHDFQQASMASSVIFSRALRSDDAQTTPARWLSRLTHLLGGLGDEGETVLQSMRDRGDIYLAYADLLDQPAASEVKPATSRPAPKLPDGASLNDLSVTDVKTLVNDPYDIYAKRILVLRKVNPIGRAADTRDRGTALHAIAEAFSKTDHPWTAQDLKMDGAYDRFVSAMDQILEQQAPNETLRLMWRTGILRVLEWFLDGEAGRRQAGTSAAIEAKGELHFHDLGLVLRTRADRIDKGDDGYRIYDYKGGNPPTKGDIKNGDKQLSLMALILRAGGFDDLPPDHIAHLEFIGFHPSQTTQIDETIDKDALDQIEAEFTALMSHYAKGGGFVARDRPNQLKRFPSDYEHLSRFGEWTDADDPIIIDMT